MARVYQSSRVSKLACIKARVYHCWQVYHPEEAGFLTVLRKLTEGIRNWALGGGRDHLCIRATDTY